VEYGGLEDDLPHHFIFVEELLDWLEEGPAIYYVICLEGGNRAVDNRIPQLYHSLHQFPVSLGVTAIAFYTIYYI
jgi:hypothetical protein